MADSKPDTLSGFFALSQALRDWRCAARILFVALVISFTANSVLANVNEPAAPADPFDGILPALSFLFNLDDDIRLRFPNAPSAPEEPVVYTRPFPLFAQEALDRGFALPRPFGVSVVAVRNVQAQLVTDLEVALGRGAPPPPGTALTPIPFVSLEDTVSDTDSIQLKADLWVLPYLNVFSTIGRVKGNADVVVVVDPNDALPPSACSPATPCEPITAAFKAGIDATSLTFGATAVYAWSNWFTSGTISATASLGAKAEATIRSVSGSARLGRRWVFGAGNVAAPFVGVSYFDLDQVVEAVTRLPNAFPNGDSLDVRYKARTQNVDKLAAVVGLNLGFSRGFSVGGEFNYSENSQRMVLSVNRRF